MSNATQAVFTAIQRRLLNKGVWQERIHAQVVPPQVVRPYAVYFVVGGGPTNQTRAKDALLTVTVKCVAEKLSDATQGAQEIAQLLHNHGAQDGDDLPTVTGWQITTVTQGRAVSQLDMFSGTVAIYHEGNQYEFMVQEVV